MTITAVFDNAFDASQAVDMIEKTGIPRDRVGLVMSEATRDHSFKMDTSNKAAEGGATGAIIGGALGALALGLTAVGSIVAPGIGFLAVGPVASALAGAGAGGAVGGMIGGLIGLGVPEYEAKMYESKLQEGSILVAVDCKTDDEKKRVKQIFEQFKGTKVAA